MSIIRTKKTENYCVISNVILNHQDLSFKAKGLLCYLLSKPNDWRINVKQLASISKRDGRDSVYAAIKELGECGFILKESTQTSDGKFSGFDYVVYDEPQAENPQPLTEKPDTVLPLTANPTNTKYSSSLITEGNNIEQKKVKDITEKKIDFCKKLIEWVKRNPGKYPKILYFEFAKHWMELSQSEKKMRFEDEKFFEFGKRLATWFSNCKDVKLSEMWTKENSIEQLNVLLKTLL